MTKTGYGFVVLLLIGVLFIIPLASAQDEPTQSIRLTDGWTLLVPEGWEAREGLNDGFILTDNTRFLYVMDPTVVADTIDVTRSAVEVALLAQLFQLQYGTAIDIEDIETATIDDNPAVVYAYTVGDVYTGTYALVKLGTQQYMLFDLTSPNDDFVEPALLLEQIVATVTRGAPPTPFAQSTVALCFVQTASGDDVAVRIGPGNDRAVIRYMPEDLSVRANGQFVAEDGTQWLRVSKAQLAPDVASNELWVLASEVTTSGDCTSLASVGQRDLIAAAPPITALTTSTTAGGPVGSNFPADPNAVVTIVPRAGTWRLTFDTTTYQSCIAGGNQTETSTASTLAILGDYGRGYSSSINPAADGRSFTYYGITYTLQSDGQYVGGQVFPDGNSQTTRLRPVSDSQMTGSFVINVVDRDFSCSLSIYVTVRRGG